MFSAFWCKESKRVWMLVLVSPINMHVVHSTCSWPTEIPSSEELPLSNPKCFHLTIKINVWIWIILKFMFHNTIYFYDHKMKMVRVENFFGIILILAHLDLILSAESCQKTLRNWYTDYKKSNPTMQPENWLPSGSRTREAKSSHLRLTIRPFIHNGCTDKRRNVRTKKQPTPTVEAQ